MNFQKQHSGQNTPSFQKPGSTWPQQGCLILFALFFFFYVPMLSAQVTWDGSTSTNWNIDSNWDGNMIPTATDHVIIPNVANDPIILNGTMAVAKSIKVENSGSLTIKAGGKLTISGAVDDGLWNVGTVINEGAINIDGTGDNGIHNFIGAVFTNKAVINIGALASIGADGISNTGTFTNQSGTITVDRVDGFGFNNGTDCLFENNAAIRLGATASIGGGIGNLGIILNKNGSISIDRTNTFGILNHTTFTNEAEITIGALASIAKEGIFNGGIFTNQSGSISIDRTGEEAIASWNAGTFFTNKSVITIGALASIGGAGIENLYESTFVNEGIAILNIDRTTGNGITNNEDGTFTNKATINLGNLASIGKDGIANTEMGTFSNESGTISMNRIGDDGIFNGSDATFTNKAAINIGTTASISRDGIENFATFINQSGSISIDRTGGRGIDNKGGGGSFTNKATITIGAVVGIGEDGISNLATFSNESGSISIDRVTYHGISTGNTFTNKAAITIGASGSIGGDGINNTGPFTSESGTISIDRTDQDGIDNYLTTFTNKATITIGALASIGENGVENHEATFKNEGNAVINIDRTGEAGIENFNGTFTNKAIITIGVVWGSINDDAISNGAPSTFINDDCGILSIFDNLKNEGSFTNNGLFRVNTAQAHTNTALTNHGVIEYPQGNPIPNVTNNDLIVAPISTECGTVFTNALQIGGANNFTAGGIWYKNQNLTVQGGTYNQGANTFTATNLPGIGTHTLYFSVNDDVNDCLRTVSIKVTIADNQAPNITCPANIIRSTDPNLCSAVVNYTTPIVSDNCSGASAALVPPSLASGSAFPKGIRFVTWEATDGVGNTKRCTFTVTVNDTQKPTIACPPNKTQGTDLDLCSAVVHYNDPVPADNCPNATAMHLSGGISGAQFPKGQTTVIWKASDEAGNTKTCTFKITVNDTQAPSISCPGNQSKNTDPGLCSAVVVYNTPTATDNCTPPLPTVAKVSGPASGSPFSIGTTNVVWKATDASGNTKTCSFKVTVTDNELPKIVCPDPVVVAGGGTPCKGVAVYPDPTVSDNCDGNLTPFLLSGLASGSQYPAGVSNNTWRVIAGNGQIADCSFTVTVECPEGMMNEGVMPSSAKATAGKNDESRAAYSAFLPAVASAEEGRIPNSEFHLAPNPTSGLVWINLSVPSAAVAQLNVMNLLGQSLLQRALNLSEGENEFDLDLQLLPTGTYLVRMVVGKDQRVMKLVKE
ncbi:MAG: HYR domain-containing protein [Saprospiraceae bacterium]